MDSMKDALTMALEHPIEEKPRTKSHARRKKHAMPRPAAGQVERSLPGWLIAGIAGVSVFLGAYKLLRR